MNTAPGPLTSDSTQADEQSFRKRLRETFDQWTKRLKAKAAGEWKNAVASKNRIRSLQNAFKSVDFAALNAKPTECVVFLKELATSLTLPDLDALDEAKFWLGPPTGGIIPKPSDSAGLRSGPDPAPSVQRTLIAHLSVLRDRIAKSEAAGDKKMERDLRENYAQCLRAVNAWFYAGDAFGQIAEMHIEVGDPVAAVRYMLDQGDCYYRAALFAKSETTLQKAAELLNKTTPAHCDLRTELRLWELLGLVLCRLGKHKEALAWLDKADAVSREQGFSVPRANASRNARRGVVLMEMERYEDAIIALRTSVRLRCDQKAYPELERSLKYVGLHHYTHGRYAEALSIWGVCLPLIAAVGDEAEQASVQYYRLLALDVWAGLDGKSAGTEIDVARVIESLRDPDEKRGAQIMLSRHKPTPPILRRYEASNMVIIVAEQIAEIAKRRQIQSLLDKVSRFLPKPEVSGVGVIESLAPPHREAHV